MVLEKGMDERDNLSLPFANSDVIVGTVVGRDEVKITGSVDDVNALAFEVDVEMFEKDRSNP